MSDPKITVGDKVQWKHADFTSATVVGEVNGQFKIKFETQGPLAGQIMTVPAVQLRKMSVLDELAVEAEPPDPFFRPKGHPDYGKDYGKKD